MKAKKEKVVDAIIEEEEKPFFLPRACAYVIDSIIVFLLSVAISMGLPQDKNHEKYVDEYEKIQIEYKEKKITKDQYMARSKDVVYDIDYTNTPSTIVTVVILILYYIVCQFFYKGKTLGKKLMKLKVVSTEGDLTINQIALRALFVDSVLINVLLIGSVLFIGRGYYYYASLSLQTLDSILVIAALVMILFRKDGRGFHDIIPKTRVIKEK